MASNAYQNLVNYCAQLREMGLEDAVISPGSRNAPVIKALEATGFDMHSCIDERSAAFIAMGIAKFSGRHVVLSCTSGSAGLNYYPAIAEAFYSQIPLLVLTADRSALQIDQWEGQSIRQTNVFSNHVRHQSTLNLYDDLAFSKQLKSISLHLGSVIPGPIHINIPLHEPLYEFNAMAIKDSTSISPNKDSYTISKSQIENHLKTKWDAKKILFFSGMDVGEKVQFEPEGNPHLCDITSSAEGDIQHWDALLFAHIKKLDAIKSLKPDVLITSGNTTVSKGLRLFLKKHKPIQHFHIGVIDEVGDMFDSKPTFISADDFGSEIMFAKKNNGETEYFMEWKRVETAFSERMKALDWQGWNQFAICDKLLNSIPKNHVIHFSNSMPIRYASLLAIRPVLCNRGTSGIDGCTSTAIGYALKSDVPNVLFTGDVAMLYDVNALWFSGIPKNFKIVVLNNQGGGIFEMIDGPKKMETALKYQTTPHQRNIKSLAAHFGIHYFCASKMTELNDTIQDWIESDQISILELKTNPIDDQHFMIIFKDIAE